MEKEKEKRAELNALEKLLQKFIESGLRILDSRKRYSVDEMQSMLLMPKDISVKVCESSNVNGYGYDKRSKTLKVVFKGGVEYRYLNVDKDLYNFVEKAPSKVQYS